MLLDDFMKSGGYRFRRHLREEIWTKRKLTVVDLDRSGRAVLDSEGPRGLARRLEAEGSWTFPAVDIERVDPGQGEVPLFEGGKPVSAFVVPAAPGASSELAQALSAEISRRWKFEIPVLPDHRAGFGRMGGRNLVVFGGAHENGYARELALRAQNGFVDARVPGPGGWLVSTRRRLDPSAGVVVQAAVSRGTVRPALDYLLDRLSMVEASLFLSGGHAVNPGPAMRASFPEWPDFCRDLPRAAGLPPELPPPGTAEPEALAGRLAAGLESGGPEVNRYNLGPVKAAILAARYAQRSSDPRAPALFRALLFRFADYYLKTPGGAEYPSDLDFALGPLLLAFADLENHPVFSPPERLFLWNLLLSCTRSVSQYAGLFWPPGTRPVPHNHQTFPARSLLIAASLFEPFGIADAGSWREYAATIFGSLPREGYKQGENAFAYETFVLAHAFSAAALEGRTALGPGVLSRAARRSIAASDNFFRPVDYGDTSPSLVPAGSGRHLAALAALADDDRIATWFARRCFRLAPDYLPSPLLTLTGIDPGRPGRAPRAGRWERVPLDPLFIGRNSPATPSREAFDKLAFRTGWRDDDHYLLWEGVGGAKVSHAHNDVNGIVRLNHLGRHWLVSNGYGRRVGEGNVAVSYSSRQRGPVDHCVLVLRRGGATVREMPVCARLLEKGGRGRWHYATALLDHYGGTRWRRTVILLAGVLALVVDRVEIVEPGLEAGHLEWLALGVPTAVPGGFRLAQQGVFLDLVSPSGWKASRRESEGSQDWKTLLEGGGYPFASFPPSRLLFEMPGTAAGTRHRLVTLLCAGTGGAGWRLDGDPGDGAFALSPPGRPEGLLPEAELSGAGWRLSARSGSAVISFAD